MRPRPGEDETQPGAEDAPGFRIEREEAPGFKTSQEDEPGFQITFKDYALEPDARVAPAGEVRFSILNGGEEPHDFLLVRTELDEEALPEADGRLTEDGLEIASRVTGIAPGGAEEQIVDLAPGRYLLVCSTPGHYGHVSALELTVQPAP